jgi:histidine triad (HIT) family protein
MDIPMETQRDHAQCTFCDLIRGAAEVSICHEDADAIAFMDIQPVNNGHVLVVPRVHYESLLDVPQDLGIHLFQVTMRLANAVRQVTGCSDFNIVVNSGVAAGQDEPHYHVHIIPRREGDGFDIPLPFNGSEMPDRTLLDAYAVRIGSALSDPMRMGGAGPESHGVNRQVDSEKRDLLAATPSTQKAERRASFNSDRNSMIERPVTLSIFDESQHTTGARAPMPDPQHAGRVHEGAHGELTYDVSDDANDAA